jgi:NRPS condensation-like uncharacterized protein
VDYTAEVFDQIQLLFDRNGFNDHQLHCVLRFDQGLDGEVLKKAVISLIKAFPILGTRYVAGTRPRWTSLDPEDFDRAFAVAQTEIEIEDFVVSSVDESIGPQIRVCLLNSTPFAVAFKMNHMVCDAADFKVYLYLLCETYSRLMIDPEYRPCAITGDRSMRGVLRHFGVGAKLKCLLSQSEENNLTGDARFPLNDCGEVRPFILTRKIKRERTVALKNYGKASGATLNDVVLTSYYRCLFQRLAVRSAAELKIPVMVDMRRYLEKNGCYTSLTNLSSTVLTQIKYRTGESFEGTLKRVKAVMDKRKSCNLGLNGFIKLELIYRILGDRIANHLLRSKLKNPLICMTNVGILDSTKISFGGLHPHDAFLCGSIKYKPYFQLAMSSYNGELTFSINLLGSAGDRDSIVSFLGEIDAELAKWELSQYADERINMPQAQTVLQ